MIGKYAAQSSTKYFGSLVVREENGELVLEYGALSAPLKYYMDKENQRVFIWDYKAFPLLIKSTEREGKFDLPVFGVVFRHV